LVAQAANTFPLNEGLKGEVNELKELASEAKITGNGANLEAKIDQLIKLMKKLNLHYH